MVIEVGENLVVDVKTRGLNKVSTQESEDEGKEINKFFNLYKVWQYV